MLLRILKDTEKFGTIKLGIFEGDIEKDRKYWKKYQNKEARYFKLGKEIWNKH